MMLLLQKLKENQGKASKLLLKNMLQDQYPPYRPRNVIKPAGHWRTEQLSFIESGGKLLSKQPGRQAGDSGAEVEAILSVLNLPVKFEGYC